MKISQLALLLLPYLFLVQCLPTTGSSSVDVTPQGIRFALIADMDKKAQGEKHWLHTVLKVGTLRPHFEIRNGERKQKFSLQWDHEIPLKSRHAHKSRGLELSDLAYWKGSLWSICDSTGILYEFVPSSVAGSQADDEFSCTDYTTAETINLVPKLIITDDGGTSTLPAKNEWIAVVDDRLYIGGHGREWVEDGVVRGRGGEWVKIVSSIELDEPDGHSHEVLTLSYRDWQTPFRSMRKALNASSPGYVSHESAEWLNSKSQWVFFPRKISELGPYDDDTDELMGNTNRFLVSSKDFSKIEVHSVNFPHDVNYGVSAVRALPGLDGVFAVIRVIEQGETVGSEFDLVSLETGESLLILPPEEQLEFAKNRSGIHIRLDDGSFVKFEGVEFLPY